MACAAIHMEARFTRPAIVRERCGANVTPHVFAGGHQLLIADLSDHGDVATFYGYGAIVRVAQRGQIVHLRAVTTLGGVRVRVKFDRTG